MFQNTENSKSYMDKKMDEYFAAMAKEFRGDVLAKKKAEDKEQND